MTREDEFVGQLESYLDDYEGFTPLPETVRAAIRAELPRTRQIGSRWDPTRFLKLTMGVHPAAKYGLVAAVVMAAAVLGIVFFYRGGNVGGPDATPTPTPPGMGEPGTELNAGTYTLSGEALNATITVPAGWTSIETRGVVKGADDTFMGVVFWPYPGDLEEVYTDPCDWSTNLIDPPVGPTVDDLTNALASQSMRGDPVPNDVVIDGYRGKVLEMSVPDDIVFADCDLGEFRSWNGRFHQGPGQRDDVYILDIEGERLVLVVHHMPGASEDDLAELQRVFESIDLQP